MPSVVHLAAPQISILTKTEFDAAKLREIEKHPSRFFPLAPARPGAETHQIRGENIVMITPLTQAEFELRIEKIHEREAAAKETEKKKVVMPPPGLRVPGQRN